ncbi:MAG: MFS transporter [Gammaproteobacteria bacterium]|nr:MFS transporter [Gammaproteobacteria bacterium]
MFTVLKNTWALMLGMLLLMLGNGLQGTLLGVRGNLENIDTEWMGFIMSAYFIGFLGGSKLTPLLLRRVGHVRVFAALASLVSAAFILFAVYVEPVFWIVLRLIIGFCFSGIYVVAESWLNDSATNETRGQTLSLYLIVQMLGIVVGQLMLNIADPGGYGLFVLLSVMVSLAFAPILLSTGPAPLYSTSRPMSLRELATASPLACFGMFMLGGIFSALFGMAPVYATQVGMSIAQVSYFITAIYLGGLVFQYPIGWLSDRLDRRLLIVAVTALGALTASSAIWVGDVYYSLVAVAFVLGGVSNPLYSLLIAYSNDYLETDQMPAASGGMLFINGVGAMGAPILVGYAMQRFGTHSFFVFLALWMSIICVYGIYRMTQRTTRIVGDAAPYVPLTTRVTQVATEVATEVAIEEQELQDAEEQRD